jgi:hypothetical protein
LISLIFGFLISMGIRPRSFVTPPLPCVKLPAVWIVPRLAFSSAAFFYESIECLLSS